MKKGIIPEVYVVYIQIGLSMFISFFKYETSGFTPFSELCSSLCNTETQSLQRWFVCHCGVNTGESHTNTGVFIPLKELERPIFAFKCTVLKPRLITCRKRICFFKVLRLNVLYDHIMYILQPKKYLPLGYIFSSYHFKLTQYLIIPSILKQSI